MKGWLCRGKELLCSGHGGGGLQGFLQPQSGECTGFSAPTHVCHSEENKTETQGLFGKRLQSMFSGSVPGPCEFPVEHPALGSDCVASSDNSPENGTLSDDLETGSQFLNGCQALLAIPGNFLGNERLLLLCVHACIYVGNSLGSHQLLSEWLRDAQKPTHSGWECGCRRVGNSGSRYTIFDSWKGILGSGVGERRISHEGWPTGLCIQSNHKNTRVEQA